LLLWITQQPLGDYCLDFPFSSFRQHVVIVDIFILFIHFLLNCYDKKAAKTNLDFVVYTCIAFEFMQLILNLLYTYSKIFKFEHHLNNGCSWLYICCTHTCIYTSTQILHYYGYTIKTTNLRFSYILYTIIYYNIVNIKIHLSYENKHNLHPNIL
jgi:hypothetical protein